MDQKDKELEDLFRPLGEKSKLPSTALTTEFKKKKQRAWTEDLPEMKFEKRLPAPKKLTPEEEERRKENRQYLLEEREARLAREKTSEKPSKKTKEPEFGWWQWNFGTGPGSRGYTPSK